MKAILLLGWIPELLSIHHDESTFDKDKEFDRMFERFHAGHVLITVGKSSSIERRLVYTSD
jgi:hypothetical protein